jgi:hypothetical protein
VVLRPNWSSGLIHCFGSLQIGVWVIMVLHSSGILRWFNSVQIGVQGVRENDEIERNEK